MNFSDNPTENLPPNLEFVEGDILANEAWNQDSLIRGVNEGVTVEVKHGLGSDIEETIRKVRDWFHEGCIDNEEQIIVISIDG